MIADMAAATPRVETWLKGMHYENDGWTIQPEQPAWISDAGRRKNGQRVHRKDGQPWGRPDLRPGDRVALYFRGTLKVPVLVEVTAAPVFDPQRVQSESRRRPPGSNEGERWPWLTEVVGVLNKPVDDAPLLADIGLPNTAVRRLTRLKLKPETFQSIVRLLS